MSDFGSNVICQLFKIKTPIVQAGMVWCSGWKLGSAVSLNGGLGIIGAGSMSLDVLEEHLGMMAEVCKDQSWGVNIPLFYHSVEKQIELCEKYNAPVIITSAGNPKQFTTRLKSKGIKVIHVVSSLKFALKAQDAGVDAVVAEGFEAGGHNGREETTTLCLLESLYGQLDIPVIAAGGMATGRAMAAAFCLGAEGIQVGSRFAAATESSAHKVFKQAVVNAKEGDTKLTLKELTPVRLLKTPFYQKVEEAYAKDASVEELRTLLGKGRSRKGIFEGDLDEGELEIGQISAVIDKVESAQEILEGIISEFEKTLERIKN